MFNRNDQQRTPKQKADRASMGIFVRLVGCAYLVYIMIKLLTSPEAPSTTMFVIAIILLILSIVVIAITITDFVRGIRERRFSPSTYEDQELAEYLENKSKDEADSSVQTESADSEPASEVQTKESDTDDDSNSAS